MSTLQDSIDAAYIDGLTDTQLRYRAFGNALDRYLELDDACEERPLTEDELDTMHACEAHIRRELDCLEVAR